MENDSAPHPLQPPPLVPTVDVKAPLKIEISAPPETEKVDYGEKLFIIGVIFCGFILVTVIVIAYFWTQNMPQTHQILTIQQNQK